MIGFNTHGGVEFYHLQSFEELLWLLSAVALVRLLGVSPVGGKTVQEAIVASYRTIVELEEANTKAQGRAEVLLASVTRARAHRDA